MNARVLWVSLRGLMLIALSAAVRSAVLEGPRWLDGVLLVILSAVIMVCTLRQASITPQERLTVGVRYADTAVFSSLVGTAITGIHTGFVVALAVVWLAVAVVQSRRMNSADAV